MHYNRHSAADQIRSPAEPRDDIWILGRENAPPTRAIISVTSPKWSGHYFFPPSFPTLMSTIVIVSFQNLFMPPTAETLVKQKV